MSDPATAGVGDHERDAAAVGERLHGWVRELFPIPRSLTGDGVRRTLAWVGEHLPGLAVHEVATGTPVLDWTVPDEWNVRGAWIDGPDGHRVIDWADHNLHLLGYSEPVRGTFSRQELEEHLHSLPEQPDRIPYRTSYWRRTWGFCLPHRVRETLPEGDYEVVIDATLEPGNLTYGELLLPGESDREVLFSCHVCHPALANDNLSALALSVALAERLAASPRRSSYRFLWAPGTIGALTWLARNRERVDRVHAGLVLANLGDSGHFVYQQSRAGGATIDRAAAHVLAHAEPPGEVRDFVPFGYDERQYNSPGFALPVGRLTRTPHGEFPEYHTSADNVDLVGPRALAGALETLERIIEVLEGDRRYRNLSPYGEPQLGRRGLYGSLGGATGGRERELDLLWVLNQMDGEHSLLDVAERSGRPFARLVEAAAALEEAGLLEPVE